MVPSFGLCMRGFLDVDAGVLSTKDKLGYWLKMALDYNKIAKPPRNEAVKK